MQLFLKSSEVKTKTVLSPWISKGIQKSSKKKEKLSEKFLKKQPYHSEKNKKQIKVIKTSWKKNKNYSKKLHYKNKLLKYENNLKGTWSVIKEVIQKKKIIVDNKEITDTSVIVRKFNNFFVNIRANLASKIPQINKHHSQYINSYKSLL